MIDFVKISLRNNYAQILSENPLLTFFYSVDKNGEIKKKVNRNTKEVYTHKIAHYKGFKFKIKEKIILEGRKENFIIDKCTISGSFHKYWNSGEHNFNDFDLRAFKRVLKEFTTLFDIPLDDNKINTLEVGVNIEHPYITKEILRNCFFHKTKQILKTSTTTEGNYYQALYQQYIIKLYDKFTQYKKEYNLNNELLRYEIKYKGEKLKKLGVNTLNDLLNTPFETFNDELLKKFDNILFFDKTIKHKTRRLLNYSNPNYWINFIDNKQTSSFNKHKSILNNLIENHSKNIKQELRNLIEQKAKELSFRGARIKDISIVLNPTPQQSKVCLITGLGISMQKDNSKLLSHTGIKYYKEFNYNVYKGLESLFLTDKWKKESDSIKIKEIAHSIRNRHYNKKTISNQTILELDFGSSLKRF